MLQTIKNLLKLVLSYFPSRLPVGMTEFKMWSDEIIALTGPLADPDSMRFAISSQIMHLAPQRCSVPKRYFVASLRKAAANQVASQVFQDIKIRQAEEQEKQRQEAEKARLNSAETVTPSAEEA